MNYKAAIVLRQLIKKISSSVFWGLFGLFKSFLFLFIFSFNFSLSAQNTATIKAFRQLNTTEQRIAFLTDSVLIKMDKPIFLSLLTEVKATNDKKVLFFWHYQHMRFAEHFDEFNADKFPKILNEMLIVAQEKGLKEELVLAKFYNISNNYKNKKVTEEKLYSEYLNYFELIKGLGVGAFKDYKLYMVLHVIGRNFYDLGDREKALECLGEAEKVVQKGTHFETLILNLIEAIYADQKDYPNAIAYANKIYEANRTNKLVGTQAWYSTFWQGLASFDIAQYMIESGRINESEKYAERGYKLYLAQSDFSNQEKVVAEFDALQVLIKIKLQLGKIDEAEPLLKKNEFLKSKIDLSNELFYFKPLKFYQNYAHYYEAKKDYTNAYRYMKLATEMQDSLNRRNDKRKLWQTEMRVKVNNFQEQIKSTEDDNSRQKLLRNISIFASFLIICLAFVVYRRIKKDNQIISQQKTLLEQSLSEKETLLKEIHHRVKNNLQIISGLFDKQARQATDEVTKKLMREGQDRVFSIALVHQNLYQSENLTTIGMKSYLEMLTKNIENSHKNEQKNIKLELEVDDSTVDIDTAIPLGLILNELITNCYKYAFNERNEGEIQIGFHQKEKGLILNVQDNGVGLPTDFDFQKTKSLGMNLVRGLVRQIGGKLDLKTDEHGTSFSVIV